MGNDLGLQYIMDGTGNYYTVNENDQLVVAKEKEEAGIFTIFEAKQRIGEGKKAKFYRAIPVGDMEETAKEQPSFEYNPENIDWNEFANYYLFLATNIKEYQDEWAKKHSAVEKEICDLLHYVELYDLTDAEGLHAMELLKEARQRRRDIKDEIERAEFFKNMLGTDANVAKVKGFLSQLQKLKIRKYHPRELPDLFTGMEDRITDRDAYRERLWERETYEADENTDVQETEEQEMSFVETIYDHQENDWLGFAKQQMEFYENAGQYMVNLQMEIDTIDQSIEEVMEQIEDANYNVAQGYKVFRELKDLRNERKAKEQELAILKTMTECFDLKAMADACAYNVTEIEKMTADFAV